MPIPNDHCEIEISPGVYELTKINIEIKQNFKDIPLVNINIEADTIARTLTLSTTYPMIFNSESNERPGFTSKMYSRGSHRSEKPVMITSKDNDHLKCDCVDGSSVNGIREQIFSFSLNAHPG